MIFIGVSLIFLDYFIEKKNRAFSEMNILLYENETPKNIDSDNSLGDDTVVEDPNVEVVPEDPKEQQETNYDYIGILEIPNINLKRGFLDLNSRYNNVDYNITVIKGSTYPNEENNNLILASHSGICSVCYFDNLYKLKLDDVAYIYFNNIKYTYKIVNIYEVDKDGTVAIYRDYKKSTLTLITCTRNNDTKQTVYILELIEKINY